MKRKMLAVAGALLVGIGGLARAESAPDSAGLGQRAKAIKPSAEELKWRQIPWQTDLTEGLRLAKQQQRPIFLWVTGDDPLERC